MNSFLKVPLTATCLVATWLAVKVSAQIPAALVARDGAVIATFHAEGAQIYQCKPAFRKVSVGSSRAGLALREPVATLIVDGKSFGRHYAGPNWDHIDGSGVKGRVVPPRPAQAQMILPGSGSTSSNIAAAACCPKPRRSSASTPKGAWRKGLAKLQAPISAFRTQLTTCSGATTVDVPVKTKTEELMVNGNPLRFAIFLLI